MQGYIWNEQIECMPQEEMRVLQGKHLVDCVARMYAAVPYYATKMRAIGMEPGDIGGMDDLPHLPFTDKYDFADNYPYGTFAVPLNQIVRLHASSGTTGKQKVVGYTRDDIDLWTECMCRSFAMGGVRRDDIVHVAYGYGLFTGGLGPHYAIERIGATAIPVSGGNTRRQVQILKDFAPTILCCTPSYALHLADELATYDTSVEDLRLRAGFFGAEPWTLAMRAQIEHKLGLHAYDIYGLSEVCGPGVANTCAYSDLLHIQADHFIAEVVDPQTGRPLPDGAIGELVFSSVTKQGTPLLRYNTHDLTRLTSEKCACGRTTPRMEKVTGRADDMLIIRGVNVFPTQIETVLLKFGEVEPHYMIQVDRVHNLDVMEIQIEMSPRFFSDSVKEIEHTERKLRNEVASATGVAAKITLVEPKSLPRSEGKIQRVRDKRLLS